MQRLSVAISQKYLGIGLYINRAGLFIGQDRRVYMPRPAGSGVKEVP